MINLTLYISTVLIWGTTWIAIKLQLGDMAIEASIVYRFALAGLILFALLQLFKKRQALKGVDHFFCLLQGCCLFCINFYCFYRATGYISSGLISVVFSMATVFNAFNNWLCFKKLPSQKTLLGAAIGLIGITTLFWPQLSNQENLETTILGLALAFAGTYCFSLGNMISVRHQKQGLRPPTTNAWGMLYGVLVLCAISLSTGVEFSISTDPTYVMALIYLAVPGTVIGFTTYLYLVGRIGADSAAYATVLFPVVALSISSIYEGYVWSTASITGLGLVIAGNIIIFSKLNVKWFNYLAVKAR